MSTQKEYALIAILATAALVGILPAFAQSPADTGVANANTFSTGTESQILPISVSTDKNVYDRQSTINVTGHVLNAITGQTVTMKVSDPIGNVVEIHQLTVDNNGDFQTTINTSSPLWTASGTYTIYVQYGTEQGLRTSTTEFAIPGGGETSCTSQQLSATLGSELHCIDYSIDGGIASGATLDTSSKSLTVNIQANNDGQITLNIPRSVLDSKAGEKDDSFLVLVDGQERDNFTDVPGTDTRALTIPFEAGSEKIEIIGTQIVPEFGPIATLVLAIAIISIIAVSAKTGPRFMPKF